MQLEIGLTGRKQLEPNHQWDPVRRQWMLTPAGWVRLVAGDAPRVRYSYDSACWYDKSTGEFHSPHLKTKS